MEIEEKLRVITVRIEARADENQKNSILGSGILWAPDKNSKYMYVFTAAHVVHGYSKLVIRYWEQDQNSKTINIDDENDIALHQENNYLECIKDNGTSFFNNGTLLKNDVAVLRCKREAIDYLDYKLKVVRSLDPQKELILRGFPKKIHNDEDSITLGRELKLIYEIADNAKNFFCYSIDKHLKCEEKNEELKGLSGAGVFLRNEPLTLIGVHSYGEKEVCFNSVKGMNIELVRDICQQKKWDIPKLSSISEKNHIRPSKAKWLEINDDFFENHRKLNTEKLHDFLKGEKCTWALINNDVTVKREVTEKVVSKINSKNLIGILGAGGEGKSTILMQVCQKLNNIGYTVYWNTEALKKTLGKEELNYTTDSVALVIDDASGDVEFEKFALQAAEKGYKVIFAARENEWKLGRMRAGSAELERELESIELKQVTEAEAEKFANLIIEKIDNKKNKSEIKKIFTENNNGFLLAAMLIAVTGKPLKEIVHDIILKIKKQNEDVLKVLAIICYLEDLESRIGGDLSFTLEVYKVLYTYYKIDKKEIDVLLSKEVQKTNRKIIRTRHSKISNIILEFLIGIEEAEFVLDDLLEDFVLSFNEQQNNKGKNRLPKGIFNRIYPIIIAILNDIYTKDDDFNRQGIVNNISEIYPRKGDMWRKWAELERRYGDIGEDVYEEYSARWILKKAIEKCSTDGGVYIKWAEVEYEQENIGKDSNEENSARWILKKACENCTDDGKVYIKWAELEKEKGNIGKDINQQYSARWILKSGSEKCPTHGSVFMKWAEIEIEKGNIGKDINEESSARWILKKASEKCFSDGNIYIKWAELEKEKRNIGKDINEEYSARWILKKASEKCPADGNIYIKWAELEKEEGNIGKDINHEYSARWILKKASEKCSADGNVYFKWATLEIERSNIGKDINEQNSARWILNEGTKKSTEYVNVWRLYACFEANFGNDEEAKNIAIESLKFNKENISFLALLQAKNKEFSSEDSYNTKSCLDMMFNFFKNKKSLYVAYLCYNLYISEEESEKYKEKLTKEEIEIFEQEKFFKLRQWEEGWIQRKNLN